MHASALLLLAAAGSVSAHFKIAYPPWRADSLENDSYSQYDYPCAKVPATTTNRTDWPVAGGSLQLDLHHTGSFLFINLGLGDNATNFNYTLTLPTFWNETGKGTLCVPQLALPADLAASVTDGTPASLQVVTVTDAGEALYNCADITLRTGDVTAFGGGNCTTSEGVSYTVAKSTADESTDNTTTTAASGAAAASSASSTAAASSGAAPAMTGAGPAWVAAAAMAAAFVWGMGI